jgi:ribA/ribD-fused uncharacterized protein
MPTKSIKEFRGEYRWLSNFWMWPVEYGGITYPSSEHAYQATKSDDIHVRIHVSDLGSSGEAKRYGKTIRLRYEWDKVRLRVMKEVVLAKFTQNRHLAIKLLATGDAHIEEGNRWKDTYWGVDISTGEGQNMLGKILMSVREQLRSSDE